MENQTKEETVNMKENSLDEIFQRKGAKEDHNWTAGKFKNFSFAANSITGFRLDQEDRYTCLPSPNFTKDWSFFGVYDGHGGAEVAEYLKRKLHVHILEQLEKSGDMKVALREGFLACDQAIRDMSEDEYNEIKEATVKEFTGSDSQPSASGSEACMNDDMYAEIKNVVLKHLLEIQTNAKKGSSTSQGRSTKKKQSTKKNYKPGLGRSRRKKKVNTADSCKDQCDEEEEKSGEHVLDEKKADDEEIPLLSTSQEKELNDKPGQRKSTRDQGVNTIVSCANQCDEGEEKSGEHMLNEKKADDEEIPLVGLSVGSTATVVIFTDQMLYVAWVGDSDYVVSKNGEFELSNYLHVPNNKREMFRIITAGHKVIKDRVDGDLNMSRAFGDFIFKDQKELMPDEQAVTAEPSIQSTSIEDIEFVMIASDGVWNELRKTVSQFVASSFHLPNEEIIVKVFEQILQKKGDDNLTLILIKNDARCKPVSKEHEKSETNAKKMKRLKK